MSEFECFEMRVSSRIDECKTQCKECQHVQFVRDKALEEANQRHEEAMKEMAIKFAEWVYENELDPDFYLQGYEEWYNQETQSDE